jgi:hypothetical protein
MRNSTFYNEINSIYNMSKNSLDSLYAISKKFLKLYSKIQWNAEISTIDNDLNSNCLRSKEVQGLVFSLQNFEYDLDINELEQTIYSVRNCELLTSIIKIAFEKVKSYPGTGQLFADILEFIYIRNSKMEHTDEEFMCNNFVSRTRFYREKKQAIVLFGLLLFKIIVPELNESNSQNDSDFSIRK